MMAPLVKAVLSIWAVSGAFAAVFCAPMVGRWIWRRVWRWRWHVRPVDLAQMPRHPETVPPPVGLVDDPFCEIAEQLLDDEREPRLADIAEREGWIR